LTGRIGVKRTGLPAKFAERKKNGVKTGHYKITKRYGSSIFSGNKTGRGDAPLVCDRAASRNGFVSEDGHYNAARNKSQQFRPAGTRVALPGTNAAHRNARAAFAGCFRPAFFRAVMKPLREKTFYVSNRRDAAVAIPRFAQADKV